MAWRSNRASWTRTPLRSSPCRHFATSSCGSSWVLDDLRALVSGAPILAEGWGLRPELVAPVACDPRRMVVMIPTEQWRQRQLRVLPRASSFDSAVIDPQAALGKRLERDRLLMEDAAGSARQLGVRVVEVDGSLDAEAVADVVADHFAPFLATAA